MAIEVWQMVQIKRALDAYCEHLQVSGDDALAIEACNQMIGATPVEIDDPEQLFHHLLRSMAQTPEATT
ncbi:hypothetical protein [Neorhizobium sp. DAR64872/K0K18]|uniref:hypothetical protein n=1 Tax=Neorhizobium sp. DAR64872/K0K18 TaxID=3421958 RepID=UPI003D28763D